MPDTILLVEDNPDILKINRSTLERQGYRVLLAETLTEAETQLAQNPALVILDIMMPDGSGLDFCRRVRQDSGVPILFLTALGANTDVVAGLSAGGDDYLPKPYDLDVLVARVAALLRRAGQAAASAVATEITRGPLRLDLWAARAYLNGEDALLTQKEFAILLLLVQNEGRQVSVAELYETAWALPANDDVRAVRPQVSRLRAKLGAEEDGPFDIVAKYGEGYRFVMK